MSNLFEEVKKTLFFFCIITTGALLAAAVYCLIFDRDALLSYRILWQILAVAALCTLPTFLTRSRAEHSRRALLIRQGLHFLMIMGILLLCGHLFGWLSPGGWVRSAVFIALCSAVYAIVRLIGLYVDRHTANRFNQGLKKLKENRPKR